MKRVTVVPVVLLCLAACGTVAPSAPPMTGDIACSDGTRRKPLNCNSIIALKDKVYQANIGLPQLGLGIGGSYEERALVQINESTQHLALSLESKCQQYNACLISAEEYRADEDRIRDQLTRHLALVEGLKADQSAARGDAVWANAVPEQAARRLQLEYRLQVQRDGQFRTHQSGQALESGDRIRFVVAANQSAYVYVLLLSSQGKPSQIFPMPGIKLANPLPAHTAITIPDPQSGTFALDDVTGTEHLQIVASTTPLIDIEARLADLKASSSRNQGRSLLASIGNLLCDETRERGIDLEPSSVSCGKARARGIILAGPEADQAQHTPTDTATVLHARPNDEVIVYQHQIDHR